MLALVHKKRISNKHLIFDISIHYFTYMNMLQIKYFHCFPYTFFIHYIRKTRWGKNLDPTRITFLSN